MHDRGFFSIDPADNFDPGIGGTDIYGNPLSVARMFLAEQSGLTAVDASGITDPCNTATLIEGGFPNLTLIPELNQGRYPGCDANLTDTADKVDPNFNSSKERELVDGSFKTPDSATSG